MIKSINRDPFDMVFFFEEEFGKITPMNSTMFNSKKPLITEILKYINDDIEVDLSDIQLRETSIWPSEIEESKAIGLPNHKVYFVNNFCPVEEDLAKNRTTKAVISFSSIDAQYESFVIVEDLFNYFFLNRLYVYFNSDCNLTYDRNEEKMVHMEIDLIFQFINFFRKVYCRLYRYTDLSARYCMMKDILHDVGLYSSIIDFDDLIVLSSLRRWMFRNAFHTMGASEFDKNVVVPVIATFMLNKVYPEYRYLENEKTKYFWYTPKLVKALSLLILEMMKILESCDIRNVSLPLREIMLNKKIKSIAMKDLGNPEELEGLIKNVREKESEFQSQKRYFSRNSRE